jgi:hypothetical protein
MWSYFFGGPTQPRVIEHTINPQLSQKPVKPAREEGIIYAVNDKGHFMLQTSNYKNVHGDLLGLYSQIWNSGDYHQFTQPNGTISYGSNYTRQSYYIQGRPVIVDYTTLN